MTTHEMLGLWVEKGTVATHECQRLLGFLSEVAAGRILPSQLSVDLNTGRCDVSPARPGASVCGDSPANPSES